MRVVVTGQRGQLVTALLEAPLRAGVHLVPLGRPAFDLARLDEFGPFLDSLRPDVVINAAAYTAVDKAESDADAALLVNGAAAGALAVACARRNIPIVQMSTDFVFAGDASRPYREDDATGPLNVYGASKLLGEELVAAGAPRHLILRTSWVISPFGANFVKTMLRLGAERASLTVVDDQHGAPSYAPHLAAAVLDVVALMADAGNDDPRWGMYHMTNAGETTWCGLARETFAVAARHGLAVPEVVAIPASAYPTPARRPHNSRLDGGKLAATFALSLPPWQDGVRACVERLLASAQPAATTQGAAR